MIEFQQSVAVKVKGNDPFGGYEIVPELGGWRYIGAQNVII